MKLCNVLRGWGTRSWGVEFMGEVTRSIDWLLQLEEGELLWWESGTLIFTLTTIMALPWVVIQAYSDTTIVGIKFIGDYNRRKIDCGGP